MPVPCHQSYPEKCFSYKFKGLYYDYKQTDSAGSEIDKIRTQKIEGLAENTC